MAQHVRMHRERHVRTLADAPKQRVEALRRHGPAALGREHVRRWLLHTLQAPQRAEFVALERMHARRPRFDPAHVQPASRKLDLRPEQIAKLARPQPVPEREQDHGRIAVPVTAGLASLGDQPLDLALGEVLPN